jgi:tetratricopeptide (TPR) repeat protein
MARGATKRNQQARAAKRTTTTRQKPSRGARRQSAHSYEQAMFFPKLRRQAKWVFVFLAFVFAIGFVVFGVGTGSGFGGLGDLINGSNNTPGGPSTSDLEKKVAQDPKDAAAWHQLATNYETSGEIGKAINALVRYTTLKPQSVNGLTDLATQYQEKATNLNAQAQAVQSRASAFTPNPVLEPQPTTPGTKHQPGRPLFQPPIINSTLASIYNTRLQNLQTEQKDATTKAEAAYRQIARLQPKDVLHQVQLGDAALGAQDISTAIAAYKRVVALAPSSPYGAYAKRQLKQLQSSSSLTPVPTKSAQQSG